MARARIVVLVSGSGTNLQALLDAQDDPGFPGAVVAVGSDRAGVTALRRAADRDVPSFVLEPAKFPSRAAWDAALTDQVSHFAPDLVVSAGFMRLVGPTFLDRFSGRFINTHPALSPSFPGMHGPRDALVHGVKVSGCTVFLVDDGVDTGPIVAQASVEVRDDDTEVTLHERIKAIERPLLVHAVADLLTRPHHVEGRKVIWS